MGKWGLHRGEVDLIDRRVIIDKETSLIEALKIMDALKRKLLIICDDMKFLGVISIGDIQRAIIQKIDMKDAVINHIRSDIIYASTNDSKSCINKIMRQHRIEFMPVIDENFYLADVIEWKELFNEGVSVTPVRCPVVIMAGGKGQRLKPLTNFIPKPLIPVSEKTIIEEIICRFKEAECKQFIISVNYKAEEIRNFFEERKDNDCDISFVNEDKPLGTGGALRLLKGKVTSTFFVSNCDILVNVDLADLFNYHKSNNNIATIVSVLKSISIPYGIIETEKNGLMINVREKPTIEYQINSGLYVIEPKLLDYIEDETAINTTDLLMRAHENGEKVGVFPVSEHSWTDMGNWDEYLKMIRGLEK